MWECRKGKSSFWKTRQWFLYIFPRILSFFSPHPMTFYFFIASKERKGERETPVWKRSKKSIDWLPSIGVWTWDQLITKVYALTGNWTLHLPVIVWCSNQLSHTAQSPKNTFLKISLSFSGFLLFIDLCCPVLSVRVWLWKQKIKRTTMGMWGISSLLIAWRCY